jgi:hypothetical protein
VVVYVSVAGTTGLQPCRCFVGLRASAFLVVDVRGWLVAYGAEGRLLQENAPQFGVFLVPCRLLGAYSFKPLALLLLRQEEVYATRGS